MQKAFSFLTHLQPSVQIQCNGASCHVMRDYLLEGGIDHKAGPAPLAASPGNFVRG